MAPQRGTKRAAQGAKDNECPAAKLLKQHGVSKSNFDAVLEAVQKADNLPEACQKMLMAVLPGSLCVPVDERIGIQAKVVTMVEEVIEDVQAKIEKALEAENAKLTSVDAEKIGLDEHLRKAENDQSATRDVVKAKKTVLDEASQAVRMKEASASERQEEKRTGDADLVQVRAAKGEFEAALTNDFKILQSGELETDQANAHFGTLAPLFGKCVLDVSLAASMQCCLTKRASERGSFDQMAVDQLEKVLVDKIAELGAVVDASVPVVESRAVAVESAQQELHEANEQQTKANEELSAALADECDAGVAVKAAAAVVSGNEPEYTNATAARAAKQAELNNFIEWHKRCFVCLKERLSSAAQRKKKEEAAAAKVDDDSAKDSADALAAPMQAEVLGA